MSAQRLTEEQWAQYEAKGFLRLGKILTDAELAALQQRIDDIMLGKADFNYDRMLMQLDSDTGSYGDAPEQSRGHKGSTLNYRKIQDLEFDPLYLAYMQRPIFRDVCARVYGPDTGISCFRAMFMNKPAHKGTYLPWHQDRWNFLTTEPLLTVWLALDPVTIENGCVQYIAGSHKRGVLNPEHGSGFLTEELAQEHCKTEDVEHLELEAGEVALLHNWLLHSSDVNQSDIARRGFSVCYMDAATRTTKGEAFPVLFGDGALTQEDLVAGTAFDQQPN
jgi:hypothetical protein